MHQQKLELDETANALLDLGKCARQGFLSVALALDVSIQVIDERSIECHLPLEQRFDDAPDDFCNPASPAGKRLGLAVAENIPGLIDWSDESVVESRWRVRPVGRLLTRAIEIAQGLVVSPIRFRALSLQPVEQLALRRIGHDSIVVEFASGDTIDRCRQSSPRAPRQP